MQLLDYSPEKTKCGRFDPYFLSLFFFPKRKSKPWLWLHDQTFSKALNTITHSLMDELGQSGGVV